jgi:soluble lytic murein transglycosylase-like protein
MHAESNFNPRAVSPVDARGLMQINGITQRHLGVRNVFDPHQNVHGGAKYLRELLNMNRGNMRLAIASYNAGPGAVRKYRGVPPYRETRRYVVKVMKFYRTYKRLLPASLMMAQNDSPNESRS